MQKNLKLIEKAQIRMVAICPQDTKTGRSLKERLSLTFPLLSDPHFRVIKHYGVFDQGNETAWPSLVLVDMKGRVRWRHITDNYRKRLTTAQVLQRIGAAPPLTTTPLTTTPASTTPNVEPKPE
ncbi:MAG: redoxin domain-containing protein [Myxococcales bacterium]|nr:redoxin domain-containing protein [Myxococcales bacterium]